MNKKLFLGLALTSLAICGCSVKKGPSTSSSTTSSNRDIVPSEYSDEVKGYGDFVVSPDNSNSNYTLENGVLTLSSIGSYTLSGYFAGKVEYVIDDLNAQQKTGVINLNNCFIYSGIDTAILWTSSKGTMEIHANADTENYVISDGVQGQKIQAIRGNNIDFRGSGTLNVKSYSHNSIKAQDIDVKNITLNVEAGKNAISCENAHFKSGNVTIKNCAKAINCAIDTKKVEGETGNFLCALGPNDTGEVPLNINISHCDYAFDVQTSFKMSFGTINIGEQVTQFNKTTSIVPEVIAPAQINGL